MGQPSGIVAGGATKSCPRFFHPPQQGDTLLFESLTRLGYLHHVTSHTVHKRKPPLCRACAPGSCLMPHVESPNQAVCTGPSIDLLQAYYQLPSASTDSVGASTHPLDSGAHFSGSGADRNGPPCIFSKSKKNCSKMTWWQGPACPYALDTAPCG